MATKWDFSRQTKAPVPKVIEYFTHPENLPKHHPDFMKSVTIKSQEGAQINYHAEMELGALGVFAKGPAKSAMEKVATEDAGFLDTS